MRRSIVTAMVLGLALLGCSKSDKTGTAAKGQEGTTKTDPTAPGKTDPTTPGASTDATAKVGVEAGGIQREANEGPAAVVTKVSGTVEVRRVGEAEYQAIKADEKLYPGDQIRTAEQGSATVGLTDESVVEVAEVSTVAIASREGTADPGSSAAVLSGLARFTVSARAPGEGPFRVYTPAGVIVTTGTTYGVGVAASGEARVGVESGAVGVIGIADLAAPPVEVKSGNAVVLEASGTVAAPAAWPADDWGTWRDETDAKIEVAAALDAHAAALAKLEGELASTYVDLDATADSVATFEATAAASADAGDPAKYEAALPDGAASIDASFAVAGRAEALTWAYAGHAAIVTDLYLRHPTVVEPKWVVVQPRVDAAILWPKRFEITSAAYLEPLRVQYYVHHPRGRVHATLVGVTVPEFYAKVEPPAIDPIKVRGRVKTAVWVTPEMRYTASARPIWIAAPAVDWNAKAKFAVAAPRAKVAWYVRPPALKAKLLVGHELKGKYATGLKIAAPSPRASLRAAWKVPVGMKVKIGAPDLDLAMRSRAKVKLDAGGRLDVQAHRAAAIDASGKVGGKLDVKAPDVKGKLDVKAPDVKGKLDVVVPDVKGKIGAGVKLGGDAKAGAGAAAGGAVKAGGGVKVKAPEVKVKAPEVKMKAKGEVKGGIKLGN